MVLQNLIEYLEVFWSNDDRDDNLRVIMQIFVIMMLIEWSLIVITLANIIIAFIVIIIMLIIYIDLIIIIMKGLGHDKTFIL